MRRAAPGSRRRALPLVAGALATAVAIVGGLSGCGDPYSSFCSTVRDHQDDLAAALAKGPGVGLIAALPTLRALQDKSPDDVRGDWNQVVGAVQGLQSALQSSGVDPATYDVKHPPPGLTPAQRATIAAAATALGSATTAASWQSVQQEARDVCHTQLFTGA